MFGSPLGTFQICFVMFVLFDPFVRFLRLFCVRCVIFSQIGAIWCIFFGQDRIRAPSKEQTLNRAMPVDEAEAAG